MMLPKLFQFSRSSLFWTLQSAYEPHILKIQINLKTALAIDEKHLCVQLQNMAFQRCQLLHVYGKRKPKIALNIQNINCTSVV